MIITFLRKPLEGSVADNALKHGCGAINIDATRISTTDNLNGGAYANTSQERHDGKKSWRYEVGGAGDYEQPSGRWPANFILTHLKGCVRQDGDWDCVEDCPVRDLDQQSGVSKSTGGRIGNKGGAYSHLGETGFKDNAVKGDPGFGDEGGASRFFKQFQKDDDQ
jgi:hypothetical protein